MKKLSDTISEEYCDLIVYRFLACIFLYFIGKILNLSLLMSVVIPILSFFISFLILQLSTSIPVLSALLSVTNDIFITSSWLFAFFVTGIHSKLQLNFIGRLLVFIILLAHAFFINSSILISIFSYTQDKFNYNKKITTITFLLLLIIFIISLIICLYYLSNVYVKFYMNISSTYSPYRNSWFHWLFNY